MQARTEDRGEVLAKTCQLLEAEDRQLTGEAVFCNQCGKNNPDKASFCVACGATLSIMKAETQWRFGMPLSQVRDVWVRRIRTLVTLCQSHPTYDGTSPPPEGCHHCADRWCVMERVRAVSSKQQQM